MKLHGSPRPWFLAWLVLSIALSAYLEGLSLITGVSFSWKELAIRWLFVAGLLLATRWIRKMPAALMAATGAAAAGVYVGGIATWAAWILVIALYLLLLKLDGILVSRQVHSASNTENKLKRLAKVIKDLGMRGLLALVGGAVPAVIAQVESHFAEEEFFVALQGLALVLFWLLLLVAQGSLARREPVLPQSRASMERRWLSLTMALLLLTGVVGCGLAYQHSFYPSQVPSYPGISSEVPFLCGKVSPDPQTFDGKEVFDRLLARVEANPHKGPPEYGMLALGTHEQRWAEAFRLSLLDEAAEGRFTGPAHSVKFVQYEAALRAYYLPRVCAAFPTLFSNDELNRLQEWFAAINRRALTVEWVDWMYALALAKWPEGPYENQENGAGLLALLESTGLAAAELSPANQGYLARNRRGWATRFRNTDDALIYQPEWITNAYFQSLYTDEITEKNLPLSFAWLLLQALPDGAPLSYNHPAAPSLAGIAYLGASLLQDPQYLWLAGRAVGETESQGSYLSAQPGVEQPLPMTGSSPTQGSCLLYGDSGLPNQAGPLAPDKIVFRDGWSEEGAYLLLNLRFTGWHRYKATNTITLVYQEGVLAADLLEGRAFTWLPLGRSLFRDKRIPRENLNGLLIERSGMSAFLYRLTGIGGPWAQDPPYYAVVVDFETGSDLDQSHTRLTNWRGWQHDRWVYFYHNGGPILVVDEAMGPSGSEAALVWHLKGEQVITDRRIRLRSGDRPVEVLFLPVEVEDPQFDTVAEPGGQADQNVVYYHSTGGKLRLVTLFLLGHWAGAEAEVDSGRRIVSISQGQDRIDLLLPFGD